MECSSRDVIQTQIVRKLSRRARAYICAYFELEYNKNNDQETPAVTLAFIERLVKAFKTHRAALDFDAGFVNAVVLSQEAICEIMKNSEIFAFSVYDYIFRY
jgi:hypothetical protein